MVGCVAVKELKLRYHNIGGYIGFLCRAWGDIR